MKRPSALSLLISVGLIGFMFFIYPLRASFLQNKNDNANSGGAKTQTSEEDTVYSAREVDVKAKIMKKPNASTGNCKEDTGQVRLSLVLHKSGKVTDIKLLKGVGCSFDKNSIKAAGEITFTPAIKDGKPVSQRLIVQYVYNRF